MQQVSRLMGEKLKIAKFRAFRTSDCPIQPIIIRKSSKQWSSKVSKQMLPTKQEVSQNQRGCNSILSSTNLRLWKYSLQR